MKIKGLKNAIERLAALEDKINLKIDSIGWAGETPRAQERDRQRDEYYNFGLDLISEAKEKLEELSVLVLKDFG